MKYKLHWMCGLSCNNKMVDIVNKNKENKFVCSKCGDIWIWKWNKDKNRFDGSLFAKEDFKQAQL